MNNSETKVFENHAQDSRIRELDGYSPAIPAKAGTGGGQPPARPRAVWAYDGWNQAAYAETCQTLRAVASEGEANDDVVKVCVIW